MDELQELQEWFHSHCDGEWEQKKAIEIVTCDNPGWNRPLVKFHCLFNVRILKIRMIGCFVLLRMISSMGRVIRESFQRFCEFF
jgi:hypothetical protein